MCDRLTVFRFSLGDCTNGGLSSRSNAVYKDCGKAECPVPREIRMREEIRGRNYLALVAAPKDGMAGPMHGGNLAEGVDADRTIYRIHDRFETWPEYDLMST